MSPKRSRPSNDDDDDLKENGIKLSNNRYLTVSEFKNKIRIDIREYYINEDGERKPGKKGISLTLEEWKQIVNKMDDIKKLIKNIDSDESD